MYFQLLYGNVFFGAKVHTIAKIIKIHVAYSLISENVFAKFSKNLKFKFFCYIWTQKEKKR
jgi:hypothetical protein